MRELGKPALIFAPTVTIRNQWAHRLRMLLPEDADYKNWIGHDLSNPRPLTVVTYQALLAALVGREESFDPECEDDSDEEDGDATGLRGSRPNSTVVSTRLDLLVNQLQCSGVRN